MTPARSEAIFGTDETEPEPITASAGAYPLEFVACPPRRINFGGADVELSGGPGDWVCIVAGPRRTNRGHAANPGAGTCAVEAPEAASVLRFGVAGLAAAGVEMERIERVPRTGAAALAPAEVADFVERARHG